MLATIHQPGSRDRTPRRLAAKSFNQWNGPRIGRYLRRSLGDAKEVDVIFCPGMGNGDRHADQIYTFWGNLRIWFRQWHTFARGGQEFNAYRVEPCPRTHPAGLPTLDRAKVDELKAMVVTRLDTDPPVLLVGFSAGAYLVMIAARDLRTEGVEKHRMGIVALGHTLFPSDRWGPLCDVPGVVIIGEKEQLYTPYLNNLTTQASSNYYADAGAYVNLADLPGGILMDEVGASSAFGGCAGTSNEYRHLARALPACLVFSVGEATPSVTIRGCFARGC